MAQVIEKLRQINKKINHHFWFIYLKNGSVEAFRFEDYDDYEHEISHFITHFIIIINKLHLHKVHFRPQIAGAS